MKTDYICIPILGIAAFFSLAADPSIPGVEIKSEMVCRMPADRTTDFRLITSADMSQVAAIDRWEEGGFKKWYVSVNGRVWDFYTAVDAGSAQFSSDGKHLSLLAEHDNSWFLITDNADARQLGPNKCSALVMSRDGKHDACVQRVDKAWHVLADGKEISLANWPGFEDVAGPIIDSEGRVAFVGRTGSRGVMVLGGKALGEFQIDRMTTIAFSADEKHVVCGTFRKTDTAVVIARVVDGQEIVTWKTPAKETRITAAALSDDGEVLAWTEADNDSRIVVNGAKRDAQMNWVRQIIVGRDGRHIAWIGNHAGDERLVVDGILFFNSDIAEGAAISFSGDDLTVQCVGKGRHFEASYVHREWTPYCSATNSDGTLKLTADPGVGVNGHYFSDQKYVAMRMGDSQHAYVLTERPRSVQVNDKILNDLTRYELKLQEK